MDKKGFYLGNNNTPPSLPYYESSKAKGETLYLDSDEFADIISYYSSNGFYDEALKASYDALSIHPNNEDILLEKAYIYLYKGAIDKAEKLANQLTKKNRTNDVVLLNIEICLASRKTHKIEPLLSHIEHPNNLDTIVDVCYVLMSVDEISNIAKEWIAKGLAKYPKEESFLQVYAEYLKRNGELEKAAKVINQLIDTDPYNTYYWWTLSVVYFELTLYEKCKEALEFTLATDEDFADAYYILGQLKMMSQEYKNAIDLFKVAAEKGSSDIVGVYMNLANSSYQINNKQHDKYFKLAVTEALSDSNIEYRFITEDNDIITLEELDDALIKPKNSDRKTRFNSIERDKMLNVPSSTRNKDAQEILEGSMSPDQYEPISILSEKCNDDNDLIEAILSLEDGDIEKAREYAKVAGNKSTTIHAIYELGNIFLELNDLTSALYCFEKVDNLSYNYKNVVLNLVVLSLFTFNFVSFSKYNMRLERQIDLRSLSLVVNQLEMEGKIDLLKLFLNFQKDNIN